MDVEMLTTTNVYDGGVNSFLVAKINIYCPRNRKSVKSRTPCKHKIKCKCEGGME